MLLHVLGVLLLSVPSADHEIDAHVRDPGLVVNEQGQAITESGRNQSGDPWG